MPNVYEGSLKEEEEVLQWLIQQKTEDRIELITRVMLETMVEETQYLAVYFCKWIDCAVNLMFACFFETLPYFYTLCFIFYFCFWLLIECHIHTSTKSKTSSIPTYHKIINLVPEKYIKPPSYCRSLCTDRFMKSNFKTKHMHERKDGFKKRKKLRQKSEADLLLLRNYRNKNIPKGTFFIISCS